MRAKHLLCFVVMGLAWVVLASGHSLAVDGTIEEYLDKAAARIFERDYQGALTFLEKALAIDENDVRALAGIGNVYAALQQQDKAIVYLEKAIALDPTEDTAYFGLGACYMDLQQHNKAIPYLQKAIELRPSNTQAQETLAIAFVRTAVEYGKMQRNQEAKEYMQSAIAIFEKTGNRARVDELKTILREMPD